MKKYIIVLFASIVCLITSNAFSADWDITQLTDTSYNEYGISMYGNKLVWQGHTNQNPSGGAYNSEIFYYDGNSTHQLTNTGNWNMFPKISSGGIAWSGNLSNLNGASGDAVLYDYNTSTSKIIGTVATTNSPINQSNINIYENKTVWVDATSQQMMLYDGNNTTVLPGVSGARPRISSGGIIYSNGSNNHNYIYLYDWNNVTDLGETIDYDAENFSINQQINDSKVTWFKNVGSYQANEVMLRDTITGINTQITNGNIQYGQAYQPVVSGNYVAWYDRGIWGIQPIKLYDGQSIVSIAQSDWVGNLYFGDDYLTWSMRYNGQSDLFVYDLASKQITQLTNDIFEESSIIASGNYISYLVYSGRFPVYYNDVYLASRNSVVPEPATMVLLGIGGAIMAFTRKKRI